MQTHGAPNATVKTPKSYSATIFPASTGTAPCARRWLNTIHSSLRVLFLATRYVEGKEKKQTNTETYMHLASLRWCCQNRGLRYSHPCQTARPGVVGALQALEDFNYLTSSLCIALHSKLAYPRSVQIVPWLIVQPVIHHAHLGPALIILPACHSFPDQPPAVHQAR